MSSSSACPARHRRTSSNHSAQTFTRGSEGTGAACARLGRRFRKKEGGTHETVIEIFHRAGLTPWFTIQPDLQFIVNTGGSGRNALAAGVRFEILF